MLHPAKFHCFNCEVKFSRTVATVLFIALHNSLMLMQCIEALPFL